MISKNSFEEKIAELKKLEIWPKGASLKPDEVQHHIENVKLGERQHALDSLFNLTHKIQTEVMGGGGMFSTPVPDLQKRTEKAALLNINELKNEIEATEAEIERIENVAKIFFETLLSPEAEERALSGRGGFGFQIGGNWRGFQIHGQEGYAKIKTETEEKLQVLEVAKLFYHEVIEICSVELQKRKDKTPDLIMKADSMCIEAKKLQKRLLKEVKAFAKNQDKTSAENFSKCKNVLNSTEKEFIKIKRELKLLDSNLTLPVWPIFSKLKSAEVKAVSFKISSITKNNMWRGRR